MIVIFILMIVLVTMLVIIAHYKLRLLLRIIRPMLLYLYMQYVCVLSKAGPHTA
jgi:hypothetical protein